MKHWPTRSERARHEFTAGLVGDCARMLDVVTNNRMGNLENIKDRSQIALELYRGIRALRSLLQSLYAVRRQSVAATALWFGVPPSGGNLVCGLIIRLKAVLRTIESAVAASTGSPTWQPHWGGQSAGALPNQLPHSPLPCVITELNRC